MSLLKKLFHFVAVMLATVMPVLAQTDNRNIIISVGEIRDLNVPFTIKSFEPGNRDIIRGQSDGAQKVTVTAIKEGNTDLKVIGTGDETATFKITIGSSLDAVRAELSKDLENIPGVEVDVGLGKVVLRGIITKPKDWSYLKKTVLPTYGDQVQCKVQFRLQDEMLLKLKNDLQKNRFKVQEGNDTTPPAGTLNLFTTDNNVFINGSVFSQGDLQTIKSVVNSCSWLTIRKEGDKLEDDACYAVVNVSVAPVMLELDVTFVGVSDAEAMTVGANLLKNGLAVISGSAQIAGNVIHGAEKTGNYVVQGNIGDTIKAISGGAGVGPARFSSMGHLTFKNDATDWKIFHDGGTIELPISGGVSGTSSLQQIDYGLILKAKGGLSDADNAALDLQVEMSIPVQQGSSPAGAIYNLKRSRMESTVVCPVGKTLVMGGTKQLTEGVNIDSETPFLGKLPVLQYLFSERSKAKSTRQILILISPQISRPATASEATSNQTADTVEKADKPLKITKPGLK